MSFLWDARHKRFNTNTTTANKNDNTGNNNTNNNNTTKCLLIMTAAYDIVQEQRSAPSNVTVHLLNDTIGHQINIDKNKPIYSPVRPSIDSPIC